jgi:hypothetical protein
LEDKKEKGKRKWCEMANRKKGSKEIETKSEKQLKIGKKKLRLPMCEKILFSKVNRRKIFFSDRYMDSYYYAYVKFTGAHGLTWLLFLINLYCYST